ncbi:DUF4114 domain-containing protein [Flavobacterium sp.]|uniref:DUF4114 domain-containing protein n=1 Tax=Flavobacterium sp. TaxID=239 RepID=UPI00260F9769|nr:DUF4114 domain-containing protein [Flavobacterium sp.]
MKTILATMACLFCAINYGQTFQYLGPYTADGTPLYFDPSDVITPATLSLVSNSLPENYPVPIYNPQYISSGYGTDIIVDSLADVWVTFVSEGAGYRNVLGFYTYDINNPPTTAPTASQITIIFPNVSGAGSGGSLVAGNKVKIGTFPAGTGIGWVLLANGWNGAQVTNGSWRLFSNPDFNPEATSSLRQHNVLLNDPDNQRVILGFEDIRRDNGGCDNDFNDAVFYITSNPYEALRSTNLADVSSAADVSSGNNGGLESKGDLATLIAKRNFNRIKNNAFADRKVKQTTFSKLQGMQLRSGNQTNFAALLPDTGMFGNETTYVSSPTDLIGITNANQVYSVDYYQGETRVAAVLATTTTNGIYGHSKAICDRLNNSTLEDVRTINLNGFEIIMVKIKRANGAIEYALNFSIQQSDTENTLHSYWNIAQYPSGDYTNFQVWGSSMGEVCSITNYIIAQYQAQGTLASVAVSDRIPSVFVRNGYYKNGTMHLSIINKSGATSMLLEGNKRTTELANLVGISQTISLSNDYLQELDLSLGGLFDLGFSITGSNSPQQDALYMADGPWGLDYAEAETTIANFQISNPPAAAAVDAYAIERNVTVSGQVLGTLNIFRNILPGELTFDASEYAAVGFSVQNALPIEVVLVTENTTDWSNRLRFQIPAHTSMHEMAIAFADFTNNSGDHFNNEKIKGFVFSIAGNYTTIQDFTASISNLALKTAAATLGITTPEAFGTAKFYSYPNPCQGMATLVLPQTTAKAEVSIVDLTGKILKRQTSQANTREITVPLDGIAKGMYFFEVITAENQQYQTKFLVN